MKALSLHQPWASLVAAGHKLHETRSWMTYHRGWIAIHAAKKWNGELERFLRDYNARLTLAGLPTLPDVPPLGAVVALAELVGCESTVFMGRTAARDDLDLAFGDWSPGRWAWSFATVYPLPEPVPCPGAQGLWVVPEAIERRLWEALERAGVPS